MGDKYGLEELREGKNQTFEAHFFLPLENSSLFQHILSWPTLVLPPPTDRRKSPFLCVLSPTSTHCQDSHALSLSRQPVPKEDDNLTKAVYFFFPFTTWKKVLPPFGGKWFWS